MGMESGCEEDMHYDPHYNVINLMDVINGSFGEASLMHDSFELDLSKI